MIFIDERFGLPTILDILAELEKPARDPRGEFKMATFTEGVNEISDLQVGMILEGVVSNVANFGALWILVCIKMGWCIFPCLPINLCPTHAML